MSPIRLRRIQLLDPSGNWEERGRTLLAEFRAAAGQHAGDARFEKLVKELEQQSSEFRCWWAGYEVRQSIAGPLKARAGDVGVINFEVIELRLCPDPSLRVAVHAPEREADERRLNRLLSRPSTGHSVGWARTG